MTSKTAPKIQVENAPDIGPGLKYWFISQLNQQPVGLSPKVVATALIDLTNKEKGISCASYAHIADLCQVNRKSVQRAVDELEQHGWFEVERRKDEKGNNLPNLYRPVWEKAGSPPWAQEGVGTNSPQGRDTVSTGGGDKKPLYPLESSLSGEVIPFTPKPLPAKPAKPIKPAPESHVVIGRIRIPADIFASWEASYAGTTVKIRPFIEGKSSYLRGKHPDTQPNYESELVRHLGNMLASKHETDQAEALRIQNERIGEAKAKAATPPPPPSKRSGARI